MIFRIQSLENRNQSLEQSTIDHVYKIVGWSYGEWGPELAKDIKDKSITGRYYENRLIQQQQGRLFWTPEQLRKGRDEEQKKARKKSEPACQNRTNHTTDQKWSFLDHNILDITYR
jgi:hypothetical protein